MNEWKWMNELMEKEKVRSLKEENMRGKWMNEWMSEWDIWMKKWMKEWLNRKKIASFQMHDDSLFFRRWWSNVKVGNKSVQETAIFCLGSTLLRSPIGSPMVISFHMSNVSYQDITSWKSRRSTKFLRFYICPIKYNFHKMVSMSQIRDNLRLCRKAQVNTYAHYTTQVNTIEHFQTQVPYSSD